MDSEATERREMRRMSFNIDMEDLSQECIAYLKTKEFMAKRITQQQEEIEELRQNVMYYSSKYTEMFGMSVTMNEQIEHLKLQLAKNTEAKYQDIEDIQADKLDLSEIELNSSFVIDETGYKRLAKNHSQGRPSESPIKGENLVKVSSPNLKSLNEGIRGENFELVRQNEKLKNELREKKVNLNKVTTDKFILFNELNELVFSLRRVNLDNLNLFYKANLTEKKGFTKCHMPSAKGIKYNILSSQSQISKIIKIDAQKIKTGADQTPVNEKIDLEPYLSLLKKTEEEFEEIIDNKLKKKSKSFYNRQMSSNV